MPALTRWPIPTARSTADGRTRYARLPSLSSCVSLRFALQPCPGRRASGAMPVMGSERPPLGHERPYVGACGTSGAERGRKERASPRPKSPPPSPAHRIVRSRFVRGGKLCAERRDKRCPIDRVARRHPRTRSCRHRFLILESRQLRPTGEIQPHVAPGIPDYRLVYLRPALREALRRSFAIASRRSTAVSVILGFEWPPHVLPR